MQTITLVIDSNESNLPLLGKAIKAICSLYTAQGEELYQIEVSVLEAVVNMIRYAYERRTGNKIEVVISLSTDRVVFEISNTGKAVEKDFYKKRTQFNPDNFEILLMPAMGLFIMEKFMDEVTFTEKGNKNITIMTKKFCKQTESLLT